MELVSIENKIKDIAKRKLEFSQSRTSFQIEKFIGCSEYTPVTRFRHLVNNQYVLLNSIKQSMIEVERLKRKCKRLEENKPEDYDLDLLEFNMKLEELEISIDGKLKELTIFEKLIKELESKNGGLFTYKNLEEQESIYWKKRLATQSHLQQGSQVFGISQGNYEAILQSMESPILEESNNQVDIIPIGEVSETFNQLASISLIDRDGLNTKLLIEKKEK